MRQELEKKINQAIRLLKSIPTDKGDIELSYSGGKDSDVILRLAQMAGVKVRVIYKSTSIDPPGTIPHAIKNGAEVIRPKKTFFQLVEEKGMPSRFVRFCCEVLKEYKICDIAIQGIRRSESRARNDRYKEPQVCRTYKNKNDRVSVFLPILEWTDEDVDEFIREQGIKCAPVYYDDEGNFHVERRLGCMCCPLASRKKRLEEFHKHPRMVRLYIKAHDKWMSRKTDRQSRRFIHLMANSSMPWIIFAPFSISTLMPSSARRHIRCLANTIGALIWSESSASVSMIYTTPTRASRPS